VVPDAAFTPASLPIPTDGTATRLVRRGPAGRSIPLVVRCERAGGAADTYILAAHHETGEAAATREHERLVEEGHVAAGELSVATVQRWFRRNPLPEGDGAPAKDRRAFESPRVNGIWQADTLYGPHVGTPPRRAYLQAIIDDKSRKVVSARFVARDDAASFQGTLRAAVASHGVPERLFVDNGGPYKNGQLSLICGGLGIVLLHAAVRDGAAKGKIERFNRTLRMRFLSVLPEAARASMGALNAALAAWVASYNATTHSSTRVAPNEAFAAEADRLRWLEGGEDALDEDFRNRITRKVAPDATVRVDHVLYDAPMGLVG
jgi:transposase InsO family protein